MEAKDVLSPSLRGKQLGLGAASVVAVEWEAVAWGVVGPAMVRRDHYCSEKKLGIS